MIRSIGCAFTSFRILLFVVRTHINKEKSQLENLQKSTRAVNSIKMKLTWIMLWIFDKKLFCVGKKYPAGGHIIIFFLTFPSTEIFISCHASALVCCFSMLLFNMCTTIMRDFHCHTTFKFNGVFLWDGILSGDLWTVGQAHLGNDKQQKIFSPHFCDHKLPI